jgi:3-deoxy-D-manno-octulosonic-acid transferase
MYPADISFVIKRFLKINNVIRVFISEVDYWPNIFFQSNKLNIPIYIVNARMSEKTLSFYSNYRNFFKKMFSGVKGVYVQNKEEIEKFSVFLSENKIKYYGNLKFENINKGKRIEYHEDIIIGGSTHWPEEKFLIEFCAENNIKLIIAPRNTDNLQKIKEFAEDKKLDISFYSKDRLEGRIIIVDIFGILQDLYSYCKAAYIGGGFTKTGVHNFVEALSAGIPVVIGPETKNFTNEYNELKYTNTVEKIKEIKDIRTGLEKVIKSSLKSEVSEKLDIFFNKHRNVSEKIFMDSIHE